jgi:hypothetical protein
MSQPTSKPSDEFGPCLRQEALRRGMAGAGEVVLLIDGAPALAVSMQLV